VSALMPRLPCTISLIRRGGTEPITLAMRYFESPSAQGTRPQGSRRDEWGEVRHRSFLLVIVDQFDVAGAAGAPREADAPLIIDADAVLAVRLPASFSSRLPAVLGGR
jgi:hypothetical protein